VLVAVERGRAAELSAALDAAEVPARRLGLAGGSRLTLNIGSTLVDVPVATLTDAWRRGF
jgi:hypothetical protein